MLVKAIMKKKWINTFFEYRDLIILNAIANLEGKCNFDEDEEYIIDAIEVVKMQ